MIDESMHETNKEKRLQMVKEAQKIVIDDAVWGFLWYDNWTACRGPTSAASRSAGIRSIAYFS